MKKVISFLIVILITPFGIIYANDSVYIGGDSIGIVADYAGLFVSGTFPFDADDKRIDPSSNIHINDLIIYVDTNKIDSTQSLHDSLKSYTNTYNEVPIRVIRDNKIVDTTLQTSYKNGTSSMGLYIKEKAMGVGTLTFINPNTNTYGGLGHPLAQSNNEYLQEGTVYDSAIQSITASTTQGAGSKNGTIDYNTIQGSIDKNTDIGIYGSYLKNIDGKEKLEMATRDELHTGPAFFYTVLKGTTVEKFDIDITNIKSDLSDAKAIEFTIRDKEVIERCGGVVHGMSGSPIVQDNKIIAAITHVIVDEPQTGYAIFIENMYEQTQDSN